MSIIDEKELLTDEEKKAYLQLLKQYGYAPHDFLAEVTEDQAPMDMNDMDYVIILNVKVTHKGKDLSHTYVSKFGSGTWIAEFENDLHHKYY